VWHDFRHFKEKGLFHPQAKDFRQQGAIAAQVKNGEIINHKSQFRDCGFIFIVNI